MPLTLARSARSRRCPAFHVRHPLRCSLRRVRTLPGRDMPSRKSRTRTNQATGAPAPSRRSSTTFAMNRSASALRFARRHARQNVRQAGLAAATASNGLLRPALPSIDGCCLDSPALLARPSAARHSAGASPARPPLDLRPPLRRAKSFITPDAPSVLTECEPFEPKSLELPRFYG